MLNNSTEFFCLLLPYRGEHRVGYWPEFMYNTRLDWKKETNWAEVESVLWFIIFFLFPVGAAFSLVAEGSQNSCFFHCSFFSQVYICHFPLCEIMCRRKMDPCFSLTLAVINISVLCAASAAWMWRWQLPRVAVDHHCQWGATQISSAFTLSPEYAAVSSSRMKVGAESEIKKEEAKRGKQSCAEPAF